jgi:hypothetical protein
MTGAIDWSDLSSGCRNTISGLVSDTDLPDYLQSTYIDATTILSPTIEGGSLTSTSKINNNTHSTVIEDSQIDFWIREGNTSGGSFGYKAGYIKAYANDTGTASSARTGLIIKAPWDGSSYSGGLTLSADRGLVIQSVNQDIFFYTPQYPNGLSLTTLASGSGGGSSTAVFG